MKCQQLLAALSDYVDGELDPEICAAFEEHLSGCDPCEVVIDNIRHTIRLYKCGKAFELPVELHEQLRSVLRKHWEAVFGPSGRPP